MTLRPYQNEIIAAVEKGRGEFRKQLVVSPTGSGKTIIFSAIAKRRLPRRTLILAHRDELIDQAIDKLHRSTGIIAQKEKADFRASLTADVVVASIQTMINRLDKWPCDHFGLVIVDEAHHVLADSYKSVLWHFDDHAEILGVTATSDRGDKKNLGQYFETVAAEIGLFDLIRQGFLSPIRLKCIPLEIDLRGVKQSHGDFAEADLGHALEPYLDQIAESIANECSFRRTLAFLPLIATSQKFVAACRAAGLNAVHVDGESPDRKEIARNFAAGRYDLVSNAMLWTEGFDDPGIDCIVMLRPTRSRPLFAQAIGRGTRIAPGKSDLLLLDYLWLTEKHAIVRPASLVARDEADADAMTAVATEDPEQNEFDLEELLGSVVGQREDKLRRELEERAKKKASKVLDADAFALMFDAHDAIDYEPTMKWEEKEATEKQMALLVRNGIDLDTVQGRGHASKLLEIIFRRIDGHLATPKQVMLLKRFGVEEAATMSFAAASNLITEYIGRNRPEAVPNV